MTAHAPRPGGRGDPPSRSRPPFGTGPALPMRVLALHPSGGSLACCAGADDVTATVETALVSPVALGDVLLVHGGVALARLDLEWAP